MPVLPKLLISWFVCLAAMILFHQCAKHYVTYTVHNPSNDSVIIRVLVAVLFITLATIAVVAATH